MLPEELLDFIDNPALQMQVEVSVICYDPDHPISPAMGKDMCRSCGGIGPPHRISLSLEDFALVLDELFSRLQQESSSPHSETNAAKD